MDSPLLYSEKNKSLRLILSVSIFCRHYASGDSAAKHRIVEE